VVNGWGIVGAAALSLAPGSAPLVSRNAPALVTLLTEVGTADAGNTWSTYKQRLAILARQQGVREATIDANVPNLNINQGVIELERTEPMARSSGGVVGALGPYLHSHVSSSLIRRGQANYSEQYGSLRRIEARCPGG